MEKFTPVNCRLQDVDGLSWLAQKRKPQTAVGPAEQKHLNRTHGSSSVGARPSPGRPVQQHPLLN